MGLDDHSRGARDDQRAPMSPSAESRSPVGSRRTRPAPTPKLRGSLLSRCSHRDCGTAREEHPLRSRRQRRLDHRRSSRWRANAGPMFGRWASGSRSFRKRFPSWDSAFSQPGACAHVGFGATRALTTGEFRTSRRAVTDAILGCWVSRRRKADCRRSSRVGARRHDDRRVALHTGRRGIPAVDAVRPVATSRRPTERIALDIDVATRVQPGAL